MSKPKEKRIVKIMDTLTDKEVQSILNKLSVDFPEKGFTFEGNRLKVDGELIEENDYMEWVEPNRQLLSKKRSYYSTEHCAYLHWYGIVNNRQRSK